MCNASTIPARRGVFAGEIVANDRICHEHYRLTLRLEEFPATRPGQFVQLLCRPTGEPTAASELAWPDHGLPRAGQEELTDRAAMLRRPLSLAGRRDIYPSRDREGADQPIFHAPGTTAAKEAAVPPHTELDIIYHAVGAGTRWLSRAAIGQPVSVLGPLGNGFTLRPEKTMAALIGGGVGIPPMLYLGHTLNQMGKLAVAFCGARSEGVLPLTILNQPEPAGDGTPLPCTREFSAACVDASIATDDGSVGFAGLVSEAFVKWLTVRDFDPRDLVVYACGPEPMMRAVADLCLMRDIECQLALERHMACGMGTCQSCVVKIRTDAECGWSFKLCCTDGPVFDAREVLW